MSLKVNGKGKRCHKAQKEINSTGGARGAQEMMVRLSTKPAWPIETKPQKSAGQEKSSEKNKHKQREKAEVADKKKRSPLQKPEKLKMQGVQGLMKLVEKKPSSLCVIA